MASFWSLTFGSASSSLEEDLRRITDFEAVDAPAGVLRSIMVASHDAADRIVIMTHLRECLSENDGKRWRRILGALMIVEQLLEKASQALFIEASEGRHFDLGMRLGFLEQFEYTIDERVQGSVRLKASTLREAFRKRMEASHVATPEKAFVSSSVFPLGGHVGTKHVISGMGVSIASVGHRDDTDSESESDVPIRRKQPLSDSEASTTTSCTPSVGEFVDLLDF